VLDELEGRLRRGLYPPPEHDRHGTRQRARLWLAVPALVAAAIVLWATTGQRHAEASDLARAAGAAGRAPALSLGRGEFWYTRTEGTERYAVAPAPAPAGPSGTTPPLPPAAGKPVLLTRRVLVERWLDLRGRARTRTTYPRPAASGARLPGGVDVTVRGGAALSAGIASLDPGTVRDLPADPVRLQAIVRGAVQAALIQQRVRVAALAAAGGGLVTPLNGSPSAVSIADLLELPLRPAVRAALFHAAQRIPGIRQDGRVRDAAGRWGHGVTAGAGAGALTMIFDPETGDVLGQTSLAGTTVVVARGRVASTRATTGRQPPEGRAPAGAVALVSATVGAHAPFTIRLRPPFASGFYAVQAIALDDGCDGRPGSILVRKGSGKATPVEYRVPAPSDGWCGSTYRIDVTGGADGQTSSALATLIGHVR
jgi:hypothetical protein